VNHHHEKLLNQDVPGGSALTLQQFVAEVLTITIHPSMQEYNRACRSFSKNSAKNLNPYMVCQKSREY